MPYIRKPDEELQLANPMAGGSALGGGGGVGGVGGPAVAAPAGEAPGRFVNLQRYVSANQGQGQAMASKVMDPLEAEANTLTGAAPRAGISESKQFRGEEIGGVLGDAGRMKAPSASTGGVATPQMSADQQTSLAQAIAAKARLAGTEGGRTQLLNQQYGGARTGGESALDSMLMGQGSGGRLDAYSQKYGGIESWLGKQRADANAYNAKLRKDNAAATAAYNAEQAAAAAKDEEERLRQETLAAAKEDARGSQNNRANRYRYGEDYP